MINIRVKPAERALIDQAAAAQGKSRTDFVLEASRRAPRRRCSTDPVARRSGDLRPFVELLDAPPRPNAQLRKLMQTKAPWD